MGLGEITGGIALGNASSWQAEGTVAILLLDRVVMGSKQDYCEVERDLRARCSIVRPSAPILASSSEADPPPPFERAGRNDLCAADSNSGPMFHVIPAPKIKPCGFRALPIAANKWGTRRGEVSG